MLMCRMAREAGGICAECGTTKLCVRPITSEVSCYGENEVKGKEKAA
jgi:hypothetical protein